MAHVPTLEHTDLIQGDAEPFTLTFVDENDDPIDFTVAGADFSFLIAREWEQTAVIARKKGDAGVTTLATGVVTFTLTNAETLALSPLWLYKAVARGWPNGGNQRTAWRAVVRVKAGILAPV